MFTPVFVVSLGVVSALAVFFVCLCLLSLVFSCLFASRANVPTSVQVAMSGEAHKHPTVGLGFG